MERLAWELRQLRERAGNPSYRVLAKRAHYSASTLAEAAKGSRLASLEVTLAYVEACGGDVDGWRERWSAAAAGSGSELAPAVAERCPYQGLTAFQAEEAEWYFGRSALIDRLLDRVGRLPMVGVFGGSGSGKSSLLGAGLLGAVAADPSTARRWRTMVMTPTEHPLDALAGQVAKMTGREVHDVRAELADGPAGLDIAVRSALAAGPDDVRALLVVDQFEEVFTLCADDAERRVFLDALLDASHGDGRRTTVVLGIRADFLTHVSQHPGLVDALAGEAQMLVGPVSSDELREIVTRPAAHAGIGVAPDLVATVLADAAHEPGALPLVSHALRETWRRRAGADLTLDGYQATGGMRGAIAQTAERVYAGFAQVERDAARRVFLRLTALGDGTEDTRRPIVRSELDGVAGPDVVARVLDELTEARLIVVGDDRVEVAHEALIRAWPRLHRWLTDDRDALQVHRRLTDAAQAWHSLARDPGALYRGAQLEVATAWAADRPGELNELEAAYLAASAVTAEAARTRDRRRTRMLQRLIAIVTVLLVVAVVGVVAAVKQRQDARDQERAALAGELALQSRSLLATDPKLAGRLAVAAAELRPDADTLGSVASATSALPRIELNVGGPAVYGIALAGNGTVLAATHSGGSATIWDAGARTKLHTLTGMGGRGMDVTWSADESVLVWTSSGTGSGTVFVHDGDSYRIRQRITVDGLTGALAVSPDGRLVAVGTSKGEVAVYDVHGRAEPAAPRVFRKHKAGPTSLAFSPDGSLLVSTTPTERPVVWSMATGRPVAELDAKHVFSVEFGGSTLAASADDQGVYLWDLVRGQLVPRAPLPSLFSWTISNPAGDKIAVADENGSISLWDTRRRVRTQRFQDRGRTETTAVAMSSGGEVLASAGFNGSIVVNELLWSQYFDGFDAQVKDVEVSPAGTVVASAGTDRAVRLWDVRGRPLAVLDGHPDQVESVAFSTDGTTLASLTRNNVVTLWDIKRRQRISAPIRVSGAGAATDLAFDPTGRLLAAASLGVYTWDVRNPTKPEDVSSRYEYKFATSVLFDGARRRRVATSVTGTIHAWDTDKGTYLGATPTRQGAVQDIVASPDGSLLATAGDSRTIKLWDADTRKELATLRKHTAPIHVLAFSRDGQRLASAGDDRSIIVWDVASRRRVATLTGHTARIRGLAFTPDDDLISGGEDGKILHWTLDSDAAKDEVCAAGGGLTRQEWATHLSSIPYRRTCG